MNSNLPTRSLPDHPDLNQLKRQAKELLDAFTAGDPNAAVEVNALYRGATPETFALHDAQLVIARAYGFESWPKLKAHANGVTVNRLIEAIRTGDDAHALAMLKVRPELARMSADNFQVLHHAVMRRAPEMVRLLMQLGANAREGVYPHREATSALTVASERGYDDIVAIIQEEEQRQREAKGGIAGAPSPHPIDKDPSLIELADLPQGCGRSVPSPVSRGPGTRTRRRTPTRRATSYSARQASIPPNSGRTR